MEPGFLVFICAVLVFMVLGSLIAVEAKDLLASVICVGAVGIALALLDLCLGAPDLAITQVVVEVLVLILLIRVSVTRRDEAVERARGTLLVGTVVLMLGILLTVSFLVLQDTSAEGDRLVLRPPGDPKMNETLPVADVAAPAGEPEAVPEEIRGQEDPASIGGVYLKRGLDATGAANYVTGILLGTRAYDTLGEATVIFVSIIGAYAVIRAVGRRRK